MLPIILSIIAFFIILVIIVYLILDDKSKIKEGIQLGIGFWIASLIIALEGSIVYFIIIQIIVMFAKQN